MTSYLFLYTTLFVIPWQQRKKNKNRQQARNGNKFFSIKP